jgi:peroxiredoxin
MKRFAWSAAVLAALALGAAQARADSPAVGSTAPDFALHTAAGRSVRLSSLRGHVVVVNFFATWCPPCRAETPDLVAADAKYARQGVVFVGVDDRERTALVQVWAKSKGVAYAIGMDADAAVEDRYDVRAIPTTYVVDKNGIIRYRQIDQLESGTLSAALDAVVAGRDVPETAIARSFDTTALGAEAAVRAATAAGNPAQGVDAGKKAFDKLGAIQNEPGSSSIDYFKMTAESDALALALADAYSARAKTQTGAAANADEAQEALQRGNVASDREQFPDAYADYENAVALDPSTASDAYGGAYGAAISMKHYADAVAAGTALAAAVPADPESWLTLTAGQLAAKDYPDSLAAARHALQLASATYAAKPTDPGAAYELGRVWLKMGRVELAAGDAAAASALMRNASAAAPGTIVAQEADEQFAALAPAAIAMTVSGAASTTAAKATPAKLWVIVRNPSPVSRSVNLAASGLPQHWLLSFCYAKVCSPNRSTIALAAGSSLRVELQVVPLAGTAGVWTMSLQSSGGPTVHVGIADGSSRTSATVSAKAGT